MSFAVGYVLRKNKYSRTDVMKKFKKALFKYRVLIFMSLIPLALLVIFRYLPMYGVQIAFRDYKPLTSINSGDWVGFKYFRKFFGYYKLDELIKNTIILNLYDIALTPMPLLFALCVQYLPFKRLSEFIQNIAIMPHFLSVVILCSIVMRFLSVDGPVNGIAMALGADSENYLTRGEYFYSIYVWSGVWQNMGYSAIIYSSALSDVPKELYEAADVDGANILKKWIYIDLPTLLPLFAVELMFRFGGLLSNNYEKILLFQNNTNLKYSQVISTYSYELAFGGLVPQYSLATAVGLVTSAVNMIMLLAVKILTRKWEHLDE